MEFRVLGSLEVVQADGHTVAFHARRLRALLAILLLHPNETVTVERLVDELWDEEPPATATKVIQNLVSQLRKELGDRVETRGQGYRIRVEPGELDLMRFQHLVSEASRCRSLGQPEGAATKLAEALSLWREPASRELGYAQGAAWLEELRLAALEERVDAELELGHDGELVGELRQLVAAEPLRERLRGQLMLALYRAGRQTEALTAYREARTELVERLGLEPGEELQRLEQAILRHDPALAPPPPPAPPAPEPLPREKPSRRRRALAAAGLALLLAVAAATGLVLARRDTSVVPVDPNSLAVVDPHSGRVEATVPVGSRPIAVSAGSGAVWVANADDGTVSRVDPTTRKVQTIGTRTAASDLSVGAGSVWVASGGEGTLVRIDPATNTPVDTFDLSGPDKLAPVGVYAVAADARAVWVGSGAGATLKIRSRTGKATIRVETGATPVDLALGGGDLWVATLDGRVLRIDAETGVKTGVFTAGESVRALAFGEGALWLAGIGPRGEGIVSRIDPVTMAGIDGATRLPGPPTGLAIGDGSVWVAGGTAGTLIQIDPNTGDVTRSIRIGGAPLDVAYAYGRLWVTVGMEDAAAP